MKTFETKAECARVEYERLDGSISVTIDGYWFSRKGWDELTAELFPEPSTSYELGEDVYLP